MVHVHVRKDGTCRRRPALHKMRMLHRGCVLCVVRVKGSCGVRCPAPMSHTAAERRTRNTRYQISNEPQSKPNQNTRYDNLCQSDTNDCVSLSYSLILSLCLSRFVSLSRSLSLSLPLLLISRSFSRSFFLCVSLLLGKLAWGRWPQTGRAAGRRSPPANERRCKTNTTLDTSTSAYSAVLLDTRFSPQPTHDACGASDPITTPSRPHHDPPPHTWRPHAMRRSRSLTLTKLRLKSLAPGPSGPARSAPPSASS
jgi:hypothetical protein